MSGPFVQASAKVTGDYKAKLRKILDAAERAHGSYVTIGWEGDKAYPNGGPRVAQVAIWNEFGTYTADHKPHTPARPFMRPVMKERAAEIQKLCQESLVAVALHGWTIAKGLQRIGFTVREMFANRIKSNTPPPLAERTEEARKRHGRGTNTLIDTGLMLESLGFKLHLHGRGGQPDGEPADHVGRRGE